MHLRLGKLGNSILSHKVSRERLTEILFKTLELIGVKASEYRKLTPEPQVDKYLHKKIKKSYKLKSKDAFETTRLLGNIGYVLDRNNVGLSKARTNDIEYQSLQRNLMETQLALSPSKNANSLKLIDAACSYSFGLCSLKIWLTLIKNNTEDIDMPIRYAMYLDEYIQNVDSLYLRALVEVKHSIIKDVLLRSSKGNGTDKK